MYRNLLIVFFVTGLWHGASWNFIVWGLYHGLFLLVERAGLGKRLEQAWPPLAHAYTLLVVLVGWVFFRAADLPSAMAYLQKMVGLTPTSEVPAYPFSYFLSAEILISLALGLVLSTPVYHRFQAIWQRLPAHRPPVRRPLETLYVVGLVGLFVMAVAYLAADTYNPFIYFRF